MYRVETYRKPDPSPNDQRSIPFELAGRLPCPHSLFMEYGKTAMHVHIHPGGQRPFRHGTGGSYARVMAWPIVSIDSIPEHSLRAYKPVARLHHSSKRESLISAQQTKTDPTHTLLERFLPPIQVRRESPSLIVSSTTKIERLEADRPICSACCLHLFASNVGPPSP
jgi:hypothetical protein